MTNPRRMDLTPSQAQALSEIYVRKEAVLKEWRTALALAGVSDPADMVGGNLADDPHLMLKDAPKPKGNTIEGSEGRGIEAKP